jgi:hypothetical protein
VLVRPDRHVAWREFQLGPDPAARLCEALRQVLGYAVAPEPGPVERTAHAQHLAGNR